MLAWTQSAATPLLLRRGSLGVSSFTLVPPDIFFFSFHCVFTYLSVWTPSAHLCTQNFKYLAKRYAIWDTLPVSVSPLSLWNKLFLNTSFSDQTVLHLRCKERNFPTFFFTLLTCSLSFVAFLPTALIFNVLFHCVAYFPLLDSACPKTSFEIKGWILEKRRRSLLHGFSSADFCRRSECARRGKEAERETRGEQTACCDSESRRSDSGTNTGFMLCCVVWLLGDRAGKIALDSLLTGLATTTHCFICK